MQLRPTEQARWSEPQQSSLLDIQHEDALPVQLCQSGGRVYAPLQRHLQRQRDSCTVPESMGQGTSEAEQAPACEERTQLTLLLGHSLRNGPLVELHDDADAPLLDAGPMHLAHSLASQRGMAQQLGFLQTALHNIWATANVWSPLDSHLQAGMHSGRQPRGHDINCLGRTS